MLERKNNERDSLSRLNNYRQSLSLETVTLENIDDDENELPNGDEHWNTVIHKEASKILMDSLLFGKLTVDNTTNTMPDDISGRTAGISQNANN